MPFKTGLGQPFGIAEKRVQGVLHTAACGLCPAMDAARIDRLARDTGDAVDVGGVHAFILVRDPRHFAFAGAHIGGGHVLRGVDHVALDQLIGKTARDQFQLVVIIFARINAQPALGPTKGRFDQRTFIGHQCRQRFDLVLVYTKTVADAAFDRFHMFGMDRPVPGESLDTSPQAHPETDRVGRVANTDLFFQPWRQVHQGNRPVEHDVHTVAKAGFICGGHRVLLFGNVT